MTQNHTDWESDEYKRARFHYLLQILYGESLAVHYCEMMSAFAPTSEARDFLLQQEREENTHLELLTDTVSMMERPPAPISKQMRRMHEIMSTVLEKKDWAACILIQNFIVEGLSLTLCEQQGKYGDEKIHQVFERIVKDEVRHVEFGIQELKKIIDADTNGTVQKKLIRIQRKTLFHAVLLFKDLAPDADDIGIKWDDLAEKVLREHMERIKRAGLRLPLMDRLFLKIAIAFFVAI
ncbi:MAG TPA: ferritin-like domain-containing protein [Candidatus Paceibacterota bacterium]